jgi:hypothetical protein
MVKAIEGKGFIRIPLSGEPLSSGIRSESEELPWPFRVPTTRSIQH